MSIAMPSENQSILSPKSEAILSTFQAEFNRAHTKSDVPVLPPYYPEIQDPKPYIDLLREMMNLEDIAPANLAEAILPRKLLNEKLEMIDTSGHLKLEMPAGHIIQPVPIPFTYRGHRLSDDELIEGEHFTELDRTNEKEGDKTVKGFFPMESQVHKLFPKSFQECCFTVPEYEEEATFTITEGDRLELKKRYTEAFYKLHDLISNTALAA